MNKCVKSSSSYTSKFSVNFLSCWLVSYSCLLNLYGVFSPYPEFFPINEDEQRTLFYIPLTIMRYQYYSCLEIKKRESTLNCYGHLKTIVAVQYIIYACGDYIYIEYYTTIGFIKVNNARVEAV
ncbi:hypothetical protein H8356DRAFT_1424905 [Neocallimastix lanati (nom. inval.)]|nr:hypothetical protein H8356DRAFT_1424905 [Neocallimastix sp. JGI-2020a]